MKVKHNFKNLKVWQKAVELAVKIYRVTGVFPSEQKFGLTSQMRRSSVSIASIIAEGTAKSTTKSFSNSLDISLGESFELETQIIIAFQIGLLTETQNNELVNEVKEIQKMISGLNDSIQKIPDDQITS